MIKIGSALIYVNGRGLVLPLNISRLTRAEIRCLEQLLMLSTTTAKWQTPTVV